MKMNIVLKPKKITLFNLNAHVLKQGSSWALAVGSSDFSLKEN